MEVICLEDEAFYSLIEQVFERLKTKEKAKENKWITGEEVMQLLHISSEAKNRLKTEDQRVSDIAYDLGFENLPYFSRLFKKETGISPNQFKKGLMN